MLATEAVVLFRWVFFTGHIPHVKEQVIMLQINKQDQMCLLALIIIKNVL